MENARIIVYNFDIRHKNVSYEILSWGVYCYRTWYYRKQVAMRFANEFGGVVSSQRERGL